MTAATRRYHRHSTRSASSPFGTRRARSISRSKVPVLPSVILQSADATSCWAVQVLQPGLRVCSALRREGPALRVAPTHNHIAGQILFRPHQLGRRSHRPLRCVCARARACVCVASTHFFKQHYTPLWRRCDGDPDRGVQLSGRAHSNHRDCRHAAIREVHRCRRLRWHSLTVWRSSAAGLS